MMKTLLFFFSLNCIEGFSQKQGQVLIDSLDAALPKMKDDSSKVKALSYISLIYYSVNPLKSFPYAERGLQLAENIKWKKGIANLHNNLGCTSSILVTTYWAESTTK